MEQWLPVVGLEGRYRVSDCGSVANQRTGRILKGYLNDDGYLQFVLLGRLKLAHRMVAEAFLGPAPSPNHLVCHNNNRPADNWVGNLRWDTQVGNLADRIENGTSVRGARNPKARLTESDVIAIRNSTASTRDLMEQFGVSKAAITAARSGRSWSWLKAA